MRHGNKINHLSRKYGHRKALLSNMAISLIKHKRIFTTTAKAKELRKFIEPLITRSKTNEMSSRRTVFRYLQNKEAVKELFEIVAPKVGDRPGGYTRILKTHNRLGDNAEMCMMELVDFNEIMLQAKAEMKSGDSKKKTRRSRRGSGASASNTANNSSTTKNDANEESKAKDSLEKPIENAEIKSEAESTETKVETNEETPVNSDDLTKIEGIGPKIAEALNANNVSTYSDLAALSTDDIKAILEKAEGNFASHDPSTWAKQAQMAADGLWDELKKWQDELDGGKEK